MNITYNPVPKSSQLTDNRKGKANQRKRGSISPSVRSEVRDRSKGLCEVRTRCKGDEAVHMCHTQSRNTINETTADDLLHGCVKCHLWLDTTAEGIKFKRSLREKDAG